MEKFDQAEIKKLLEDYLQEMLEDSEKNRVAARKPMNPEELDNHLESLSYLYTDFREDLGLNDYGRITQCVDDFLTKNGIKVDRKSEIYRMLCGNTAPPVGLFTIE